MTLDHTHTVDQATSVKLALPSLDRAFPVRFCHPPVRVTLYVGLVRGTVGEAEVSVQAFG